jgi:molecular chaperone HtpG
VSRETLQNNSQVKVIKKKILGKVLEMIKNLMNDEEKYLTFFKEYGKNIKLGILENQVPPKTIEKLITFLYFFTLMYRRFHSSKTGKMISLSDYVKGMSRKQPQLYYVLGESIKEIESLPYLETINAKGYDVLYFIDPLDAYLVQGESMKVFQNVTLQNIAKSGVDLGGDGIFYILMFRQGKIR